MEQIIGLAALEKNIQALIREVDSEEFENEMLKIGRDLRNEFKTASPVGPTGNLKKSWKSKKFRDKRPGSPAVFVATDRKLAPHAHLVEYGHGGIHPAPPHPFVRPTLDRFKNRYPRLVATMLREKFGKTVAPTTSMITESM